MAYNGHMRIEHVTLLVKDRQATLEFFKDNFGLEHRLVGDHIWVIVGDQYIHVTENSGDPVPGTFYHFCIETDHVNSLATKARANGIELIDETPGRAFFVRDPDGNLIEFAKTRTS